MRKLFLAAVLALGGFCCQSVLAVPAYPGKKFITRSDGTQVAATLVGDEHLHYYKAEDGVAYRQLVDGSFAPINGVELLAMKQEAGRAAEQMNARRARTRVGDFQPGGIKGKKKGVVILVSFSDNEFSIDQPHATFNDYFNKPGFNYGGMAGSVSDYFKAQSYGQLEVEFDVVGPCKLSKAMGFYGGPVGGMHDANPQEMAMEACRMANAEVNFADYDWNGDGVVEQVFIFYAGYGENYGAPANTIWPHQSYFPEGFQLDNMKFDMYACTSELQGTVGTQLAGIGTACHEFSHCLGHPDTYDTSGGANIGMASWDIMCSGSYNNDGYTPAGYTAYERWMSGWLEPVEVKDMRQVKDMKALVDAPEAYVLYNEANRNEFYLLENRQQVGFDAGLAGHGLLVTHIDYDKHVWQSNSPNNTSGHERITYVPADGKKSPRGDAGDPFPGAKTVRNLNDFTQPATTLYNKNTDGTKLLHKPVENITESADGKLSFDILLPALKQPVLEPVRSQSQVEINWEAIPGAEAYEVHYTEVPAQGSLEESRLFEEDFQGAYRATAGFTDIGATLDKYLSVPGFRGENLFQTPDLLRLGSSKKQGVLRAPVIAALKSGKFTVSLTLKPFKEGEKTAATLKVVTDNGVAETYAMDFTTKQTFVFHSTQIYKGALRLDLEAAQRCYISHMALYDGDFQLGPKKARTRAGVQEFTATVKENRFVLSPANPTSTYLIRVRSMAQYRYGEWSEQIEVKPFGNDIHLLPQDEVKLNQWFDLQGRRIAEPQRPGLYIFNGKKVLKR